MLPFLGRHLLRCGAHARGARGDILEVFLRLELAAQRDFEGLVRTLMAFDALAKSAPR